MKKTRANGRFYYKDENCILLPAVTTILKATQPIESVAALSNWRNKVGNAEANRIALTSRRRGELLHQWVKDYLQGLSPTASSLIQPYCYSVQSVLEKLSDVQLVETVVPNYVEEYAGKVDLVAGYEGVPCTIEWTTAEEPKLRVEKLYDKPLQLVAYGGAINRCYGESLFGDKIVNALIVVALPGEDAEIFVLEREQLLEYWQKWLKRLKFFG
ncbi:MAG: exonuclease [Oscillatoriales cyanobacterium]|uniref:exonuclease n=1 Tax=Microcoleus sp. PH2017_05_CCC_O_A TaxID=2798816 RepID=UPI001DBC2F16|nr:exonuclease [Microcoleus sp. PH2017_05_CCC_O_A]MCC3434399.1 exonuclease [Microcoleus sp. PH2017_05_CCC_O_A]TAG17427.1 MAG: exonuclease [Oscillatoriales cyanobacterium]